MYCLGELIWHTYRPAYDYACDCGSNELSILQGIIKLCGPDQFGDKFDIHIYIYICIYVYILPMLDCLLIVYRLPLMHICSAKMDIK